MYEAHSVTPRGAEVNSVDTISYYQTQEGIVGGRRVNFKDTVTFYEAQENYILGENIKGRAEWKLRGKEKTVNGKAEYEMMNRRRWC